MPELPEVETIKLGLQKYLIGHTIKDVKVNKERLVSGDTTSILNAKVVKISRFGKGLVIDLSNKQSIAIHIKMTGQLIYRGSNMPVNSRPDYKKIGKLPGNFTHVTFLLDNGALYYNDMRQFGWIKILRSNKVKELSFFKSLGPEPLKDLDLKTFQSIVKNRKNPIKSILMEQKLIAGIGNIYANDALFVAKINPKRLSCTLSEKEIKNLFNAIEKVLKKGLETHGASKNHFVNALGETGNYQDFFKVYARVGKPCVDCGTKIQKIMFLGRGTFYCPNCQN